MSEFLEPNYTPSNYETGEPPRRASRIPSPEKIEAPAVRPTPVSSELSVYSHLNFREYLAQWFAARKKLQPGYSGALFAKKAGLGSHTLLGMVIRGDRNLSPGSVRAFIRALSLKGREALYFEKLVFFNQSKKSDDRAYYFEQLCSVSNGSATELVTKIKNHAKYLSHWYVVAVRELVALSDFDPSPEWISKKLKKKITPKQAEGAWALLLELGMVEKSGDHFCIVDPAIDIDPGNVDFAIRSFHKEYLDRAREAIDGETLEERELSSITLSLSDGDLKLLRERIKEFRKKLNTEFPTEASPRTQVVAVNMQALVLTQTETETSSMGELEKKRG